MTLSASLAVQPYSLRFAFAYSADWEAEQEAKERLRWRAPEPGRRP